MANPKKLRRTIGENPLDVLISPPVEKPPARPSAREEAAPRKAPPSKGGAPRRKAPPREEAPLPRRSTEPTRATFHLPNDLIEEARDVVVALSGPPLRLTLAAFAENALRAEIERMKRKHNGGEPFPRRQGTVRVGRPIGGSSSGRR